MKKQLPLFIFSAMGISGSKLIDAGIIKESPSGLPIIAKLRYDCSKSGSVVKIIATDRPERGRFTIYANRKKIPGVILRRYLCIIRAVKANARINFLQRELKEIFYDTNVQAGLGEDDKGNPFLFIRNGFLGKAHYIIERKA